MDRFLKYYKGHYWRKPTGDTEDVENKDSKESEIFANLIFSTAMTIAPLLTDNKPIWSIRAEKSYFQKYVELFKMAGDALWNMLDMDRKIFLAVVDALIMKMGIFKVYFDPDKNTIGEIALDVIDPRTFLIAPGYCDLEKAPWCGTRTLRSLWWIRKNYPDTGRKVKPDETSKKEDWEGKENYEVSADFATVYEVFIKDDTVMDTVEEFVDKNGDIQKEKKKTAKYPYGRIMVFTKDGTLLEDKAYPYHHGKPPFVPLYDYIVPHEFTGMGEADQIETIVLEYNLALRKFAKWVRMWADPNWSAESNSDINPEEFKEKAPGGGNMFLRAPGTEVPKPISPGQFDPSAMNFIGGLPNILEEVSGVTEITKGQVSKKQRQSALEISTIAETGYTRTRQKVRNLEWTIKKLFEMIVDIMQQYYTEPRTYSQTNMNNEHEWFNVEASPEFAKQVTAPQQLPEKGNQAEEENYKQEMEDYTRLISAIGNEKSIYARFQVEIQTNSTLPMDKQSLANLFLRLFEMGGIDVLSLLERLQIPNPEQVVERLKQDAQMKQQPPGGGNPIQQLLGGQQ